MAQVLEHVSKVGKNVFSHKKLLYFSKTQFLATSSFLTSRCATNPNCILLLLQAPALQEVRNGPEAMIPENKPGPAQVGAIYKAQK